MLRLLLNDSFFRKLGPKFLTQKINLLKRFCLDLPETNIKLKDLEETAQLCEKLNDFPVKPLTVVLEQAYAEHNNGMSIKYSINASAREAFFKFAKPQELSHFSAVI